MNLSFPEGSWEKMEHRYALFKDLGPWPDYLSAVGGLSSTPGIKRTADAARLGLAAFAVAQNLSDFAPILVPGAPFGFW